MHGVALVKYLNIDELNDIHDDSWGMANEKDDHNANQNYAGSDILTWNTIWSNSSSEINGLMGLIAVSRVKFMTFWRK